jgi:adenosyl cobinamide kinase/adenosyl cobinamide phosphate guanylyltransferase
MSVTLVLGGARSGKSRIAERLCAGKRTYIATAEAFDDEMRLRIRAHVDRRGSGWETVEAPLDLVAALGRAQGEVLVDCLTLWLTNLVMKEMDARAEIDALTSHLGATRQKVVIVSNELGLGLVPESGLSRRFRDLHGVMNQAVADVSKTVIFCVAGIPQVIKGRRPLRLK